MAQIINEEPGLGYRFGTGLASGLGQTLQALSQMKLNDLAQRQQQATLGQQRTQTSGLLQQFGLSPEASAYLATLPAKEQWAAVQELSGLGALGSLAPQQQEAQQGALSQLEQPQETSQPLSAILGQMGQQAPRSTQELFALRGLQALQQIPQQQAAFSQEGQPQIAPQKVAQPVRQIQPTAPSQQEAPVAQQVSLAQQPAAPALKEVTDKDVKRPISPAEKLALKQQLQEQKALEKEQKVQQKSIDKETLPYYQETLKADSAAKKSNVRLNRLEKLVFQDRLPGAGKYALFKSFEHIPAIGPTLSSFALSVLRGFNPDQEEFEKLSTDFIREAKDIFGARVTNQDLQAFMQIIPTLAQTNQGKLRVINNMRAFNKAIEVKANAMKQILKANGGKRPANLELLVEEYAKPELDKLSEDFTEGAGLYSRGSSAASQSPIQQIATQPVSASSKALPSVIGSSRRRAGL